MKNYDFEKRTLRSFADSSTTRMDCVIYLTGIFAEKGSIPIELIEFINELYKDGCIRQ